MSYDEHVATSSNFIMSLFKDATHNELKNHLIKTYSQMDWKLR